MKFDTKFNLGDVVVAITNEQKLCHTPCTFCAGAGKISGADGSKDSCGKCYGRGNRSEWLPTAWSISDRGRTLTIGLIEAVLTANGLAEKYMAYETGIGSGTGWNGDDLFDTAREAQAECDNRNTEEIDADLELEIATELASIKAEEELEREVIRQALSGDADTESSAVEQYN